MFVLAGEFMNRPVKVFRADLVEWAFVSSFQHRPERFNTIDLRLFFHALTDTAFDCFMIKRKVRVSGGIGRANRGILADIVSNENLQSFGGGVLNRQSPNFVGFPDFGSGNSSLADSAAPFIQLLAPVLVLFKAAKVNLNQLQPARRNGRLIHASRLLEFCAA